MMRWHRWCVVFGSLLMAYIAVTGLGIQLADMRALVTGAPATDPDMRMMRQHIYGPPNYAVLSPPDFTASTLPPGLDYAVDLTRAAAVARAAAPGADLRFLELRMLRGREVVHVQMGRQNLLLDLATGSALPAGEIPPPEPGRDAVSTRATFKFLHRFNYLGQLATGLNGLAGIAFAVMIGTGLAHYAKILRIRSAKGRGAPFWQGGGWLRMIHRWLAVAAALPVVWIVASGLLLSIDNVGAFVHGLTSAVPHSDGAFEGDQSSPIKDGEIGRMARTTAAAFAERHPGMAVKVIRIRRFVGYPQGVVIAGAGAATDQFVFDARTGAPMAMWEKGYPDLGFPSGWEWHQRLKRIHRGDIFGMPGRWLDTIGGAALAYLVVSGIWMYLALWKRRRHAGKPSPLW